MEEPNEDPRVVPELYFLIAKFLSGGPLTETAKTLLKELERVEVLPRRIDWQGAEHAQSYDELAAQYRDVSWRHLAAVCARALRPPALPAPPAAPAPAPASLRVRLSLLSDSLVRERPKFTPFKKDHTIARRLLSRELGGIIEGRGTAPRAAAALMPPRLLGALRLRRRTLGHLSAVYCLAFDCSGRYVVTGADDLLVKVWSAYDGRLIATLRGAGAEITDVCLTRDGALLACGSVDRLVRVWSLASAAPTAVLHAHAGTITAVHWSPWARGDVRWLASTSTDGSVAFWTCSRDGQFLSQPVQYMERMRPGACHMICAAWSAGGAFLAAGSQDHHVRVYMVDGEGGPKRVLETAVHADAVDSLAWAHRGLRFVSGSKDGCACVWALHAAAWRHTLLRTAPLPDDPSARDDGKRLKVTMVCWDQSDAYIITAVSDCSIRVWCSRTCTLVRVLRGHRDEAYVLEAHPWLAGVLLSAGHDGQLFVWDAPTGEILASFLNRIEGQGEGAIFDAKWGGGAALAAVDAHGHLLLLALCSGPALMAALPAELFFHTDYRPLLRDAHQAALDEQTELPPHLMPPPFLVDVEGAPHPPQFQRLVPGRENLALSQLVPCADARNRIDVMIEALAAERTPGLVNGLGLGLGAGGGPWRGEGVRHTAGSWQLAPVPPCSRPLVAPQPPAVRAAQDKQGAEMNAFELAWFRREMRRRPIMINTAPEPKRRARPLARPRPQPRPQPVRRVVEELPVMDVESSGNETSDESVRLSRSHSRSSRSRSRSRSRSHSRSSHTSVDLSDSSSHSDAKSNNSSSSQYSDWEAGAALAPPTRARRRPVAAKRYSPSASAPKRSAAAGGAGAGGAGAAGPAELPELYRPGEWLTAVSPRKAPYHPQMGDDCLYFRLGHQRYLEAVAEKDLYPVTPRDRPWEKAHIYECEAAKVVGIKYAIKPPRVACVRLACSLPRAGASGHQRGTSLVVVYHDMPDVIDFLVLRQQYNAGCARGWTSGDRFRCMIDDSWWTGVVLESVESSGALCDPPLDLDGAQRWAQNAAQRFLSLKVRWDNGEVERLSPWDLEPTDPERIPSAPGGAVPVLPHELEAVLYRAEPSEWPPRGDRAAACRAIAHHLNQVMSLSAAEPFVAPVDLQLYPTYALVVPYPIDLSTIRSRFDHLFYRRAAAAQFDVRYLASNAERFNEPHSPIVRQARLITDLLLYIISHWREVDVVAKYHELAAAYRSEDDEPPRRPKPSKSRRACVSWRAACSRVLHELMSSADAEPFREPVSLDQAPDYLSVVRSPMDLGTVARRLSAGRYARPQHVQRDIALVFHNSRLYNTNKRSRIYSMTVRLSALFSALWAAHVPETAAASASASGSRVTRRRVRRTRTESHAENGLPPGLPEPGPDEDSSSSEPLAALAQARLHAQNGVDYDVDSSDSDVPLGKHKKGKGVGKKSKINNGHAPAASPEPGPAFARDAYLSPGRGSSSSSMEQIVVEQLSLPGDDASLTYDDDSPAHSAPSSPAPSQRSRSARRKRRRRTSDEAGRARHAQPKRTRERFAEGTSPSSSSSEPHSPGAARRYESDHSYKPRCSSDDEPLQRYRERQETEAGQGEHAAAGAPRPTHTRLGGVKLRVRPRARYNEDSDEDSLAAISKRATHYWRGAGGGAGGAGGGGGAPPAMPPAHRRHRHATQSAATEAAMEAGARLARQQPYGQFDHSQPGSSQLGSSQPGSSHGSTSRASSGHGSSGHASSSCVPADHDYVNGHASSAHHNGEATGAVSISSRGRVRKLTAKARGLLRD